MMLWKVGGFQRDRRPVRSGPVGSGAAKGAAKAIAAVVWAGSVSRAAWGATRQRAGGNASQSRGQIEGGRDACVQVSMLPSDGGEPRTVRG